MRIATITLMLMASLSSASRAADGIDRVGWLQGCWTLTTGTRTVEEQWTTPRGGVMLGTGRTVNAGRLVEYEFVIIRERGDSLVYEAHPSGQKPAEFAALRVGDDEVVFENAQHDFPQRVGYRKSGLGLDAWVEGTIGGRSRRIEFPYERASCPGDRTVSR